MKIYAVAATRGEEVISHKRLSMTKALPIVKILSSDGWSVTVTFVGEEKREPRHLMPQPKSHPWKALPAVPRYMRKGRA